MVGGTGVLKEGCHLLPGPPGVGFFMLKKQPDKKGHMTRVDGGVGPVISHSHRGRRFPMAFPLVIPPTKRDGTQLQAPASHDSVAIAPGILSAERVNFSAVLL